jgi:5-methylcytosine-specific restriction endonuclease McrA
MLKRYHSRRKEAIVFLGNCCVLCGSTDELELDHINPENKAFSIAKLWGCKKQKFWDEIKKCQLLCKSCHIKKTLLEQDKLSAREKHGHISCYRYCKCSLCRNAKNEYMREWKRKNK